jgi:hypothetical protein
MCNHIHGRDHKTTDNFFPDNIKRLSNTFFSINQESVTIEQKLYNYKNNSKQ